METNEPNQHYRPVHRPHQKMRFPLFGGGGNAEKRRARAEAGEVREKPSSSDWGNDLTAKLVPLAVVAFLAYAVWDTFANIGGPQRVIIESPTEIRELAWQNARVAKKYAEITSKRTRLFVELRGANGEMQLLDLAKEKALFWDRINVRNRLTKPAGSLDVQVDTYERDTTLTMQF